MDDPNLEERVQRLESQLAEIQQRNRRVEFDKGWETSRSRIGFITAGTYCVTTLIFFLIGVERFLASALIPTAGYVLSTLSLPLLKRRWISRRMRSTDAERSG